MTAKPFSSIRLYEQLMHASAVEQQLIVKGEELALLHVKLRAKANAAHVVAYCADDRVVTTEKLAGKIPGVHGRLSDQNGNFVYACYVSSATLDQSARPDRSSFELADDAGDLFRSSEVGFDDIRRAVREAASAHLADQIQDARQRTTERVNTYANYTAPRAIGPFWTEFRSTISGSTRTSRTKSSNSALHQAAR